MKILAQNASLGADYRLFELLDKYGVNYELDFSERNGVTKEKKSGVRIGRRQEGYKIFQLGDQVGYMWYKESVDGYNSIATLKVNTYDIELSPKDFNKLLKEREVLEVLIDTDVNEESVDKDVDVLLQLVKEASRDAGWRSHISAKKLDPKEVEGIKDFTYEIRAKTPIWGKATIRIPTSLVDRRLLASLLPDRD